jgi:hypothetical protein
VTESAAVVDFEYLDGRPRGIADGQCRFAQVEALLEFEGAEDAALIFDEVGLHGGAAPVLDAVHEVARAVGELGVFLPADHPLKDGEFVLGALERGGDSLDR